MESSSKRRKLGHSAPGLSHANLVNFKSADSTRLSTASIFTLQTDELLKSAKLDYSRSFAGVDGQLFRLKEIIESIEPHGPVSIAKATSQLEKKHKVSVPYPEPRPAQDSPYKVSFEKPAQCNVVGSYVLKSMVKSQAQFNADFVVQMPASLFQDKDYQNLRYFYRRAYYLAYVAAHLRQELGESMSMNYEYFNDNRLLPVLILHPKSRVDAGHKDGADGKSSEKASPPEWSIRLIPCCTEDLFPSGKLGTTSNSNRAAGTDDKGTASTPFYNNTLKAEGTFIQYLRILTWAKNNCSAFSDACILGRIWLQQRGFGGAISQGGFGHFEWAIVIALLLQTGGRNGQPALSTSLSAHELFKATVQFLSDNDFNKKPLVLGSAKEDLENIKEAGPVLYHAAVKLNILHKMAPWSSSLLQSYAKSTLELLANDAVEKFEPTFIVKSNILSQIYDAIFQINSPDMAKSSSPDSRGAVWDFSSEVYKTLKRAYGNRAQLVHVQQPPAKAWPLGAPLPNEANHVIVGVIFDFAQMSRQMEHGPPAEEQRDAAKFRNFWGEKSELRRFKDGSILECLEWRGNQPHQICEEISRHILKRHLKLTQDEITLYGQGYYDVVSFSAVDKAAFDSAKQAFQTLEHDIRNLDDLPLQIRQLSPVSPLVRYSSIYPPLIGAHTGSIQTMDVSLFFEESNRWPENLVAIQETKIDFLLDLDRRLIGAHENIQTYLGREDQPLGPENLAYLDIVYDTGAAFRLRIFCDLEQTLLTRQIINKTLEQHVRDKAEEALVRFRWQSETLPLHSQTIATYSTRFFALSQTTRLVKQWFAAQKLSGHFSEELIELLVLHVFLSPYPWRIPSSVATGFLRTLDFLSRWDWRETPLVVDSAEELTADDRLSVRKTLEAWRVRDPHLNRTVLIVATSHDRSGLAYTRTGPSRLVASRMTLLAKAACKLVRAQDHRLDVPTHLFTPPLGDYDVLFHLSPKAARAVMREAAVELGANQRTRYKNLDGVTGKTPLPVRAGPAGILVRKLQALYDDTLIFLHGSLDAIGLEGRNAEEHENVVGAIWNPRLQRQKFRAGLPYNFKSVPGEGEEDVVEVNREAVLLEIARIGGELIKKIEIVEDDE